MMRLLLSRRSWAGHPPVGLPVPLRAAGAVGLVRVGAVDVEGRGDLEQVGESHR